jgi:hypothetical protein
MMLLPFDVLDQQPDQVGVLRVGGREVASKPVDDCLPLVEPGSLGVGAFICAFT